MANSLLARARSLPLGLLTLLCASSSLSAQDAPGSPALPSVDVPTPPAQEIDWRADPLALFDMNLSRGARFKPGGLMIDEAEHPRALVESALGALGCQLDHRLRSFPFSFWRCDDSLTTRARIRSLFLDHRIKSEAPFYEQQAEDFDPLLAYDVETLHWHHRNLGQNVGGTIGRPGADIGSIEAWKLVRGDSPGMLVAVIDSGIDYTHPDLAGLLWQNSAEICANNLDDDANGFIDDCFGWDFGDQDADPSPRTLPINSTCKRWHGTFIAGLSSGNGANAQGISGVHWGARLLNIKKHDDATCNSTTQQSIDSVSYALDLGVKILEMSFVTTAASPMFEAVLKRAERDDVLMIMSSGNDGSDNDRTPLYPGGYDLSGRLVVAYTTNTDRLSPQSNYGATSVDIAAPGEDLSSADQEKDYKIRSGSSYAVPLVAGVGSLLWSAFPNLKAAQIAAAILTGAEPLDTLDCQKTPQCVASGGRLDAPGALDAAAAMLDGPSVTIQDLRISDYGGDGYLSRNERASITYTLVNRGRPSTPLRLSIQAPGSSAFFTIQPSDFTLPSLDSNEVFIPAPQQLPSIAVTPNCAYDGARTLSFIIEDNQGNTWASEVQLQLACQSDRDNDGIPPPQDCDDTNPAVSPAKTEVCDGLDNDCDGMIDEAPVPNPKRFFLDQDQDGFGVETSSIMACAPPTMYAAVAGDCNDLDASVFPYTASNGVVTCGRPGPPSPAPGASTCQCDVSRSPRSPHPLLLLGALLTTIALLPRRRRAHSL